MNLHQSFQTLSSDRQTGPKFLFNALCFAGGQRCKNDTTAQVHASWIISPVSSVRHESRLQRITVLDLFEAAVFRSDRHIVRLVLQLSVWLMNQISVQRVQPANNRVSSIWLITRISGFSLSEMQCGVQPHNTAKIFLKYGNKVKSSKQLTDIIEHTFFCMQLTTGRFRFRLTMPLAMCIAVLC